jgi:hypothetical protein
MPMFSGRILQRTPNTSYASGADLRGRDGGGVVLLAVTRCSRRTDEREQR